MPDKIKIHGPVQFDAAMKSLQASATMLSSFDWEDLLKVMDNFETVGPVTDPSLFKRMVEDQQYADKKMLIVAATNFVAIYMAISKRHSNAG